MRSGGGSSGREGGGDPDEDRLGFASELAGGDADHDVAGELVLGVASAVALKCGAAAMVVIAVQLDDHLLLAPHEVGGVVADAGVDLWGGEIAFAQERE